MKVLLTAAELRKLITPEAELDLVSTAVGQIAGSLVEKVQQKLPQLRQELDKAAERSMAEIKRGGMPTAVKAVIREYLKETCGEEAKELVVKVIGDLALARADDLMKARMQQVEREIAEGIANATKTMRGQIEALAQEKFLELVRGASKITQETL